MRVPVGLVVVIALASSSCTRARSAPPAEGDAGVAPELVTFASGERTLGGYLYRPHGAGPFPVIVYNHGSEPLPGDKAGQAAFFVPHGFVLFVPHRRGQGRSLSAGPYVELYAYDHARLADELVAQTDDVMAAVAYARSLPYVDPARVAVVGCSFGGIESLFAAARGEGITAAVDFAGAAMSWASSPSLQERMKQAAREAKVPVFFVQAANDFDTTPSTVLSAEMARAGKPARVHIFPPSGSGPKDGHHFCAGGDSPAWGDEVLAFLGESMGSSGERDR